MFLYNLFITFEEYGKAHGMSSDIDKLQLCYFTYCQFRTFQIYYQSYKNLFMLCVCYALDVYYHSGIIMENKWWFIWKLRDDITHTKSGYINAIINLSLSQVH